jgi:drug/metabolite transporter (DMT)-like permease
MSLESVFALLAGWVILGERLSGPEWIGCGLVLAAVTVAQFADKLVKEKQE